MGRRKASSHRPWVRKSGLGGCRQTSFCVLHGTVGVGSWACRGMFQVVGDGLLNSLCAIRSVPGCMKSRGWADLARNLVMHHRSYAQSCRKDALAPITVWTSVEYCVAAFSCLTMCIGAYFVGVHFTFTTPHSWIVVRLPSKNYRVAPVLCNAARFSCAFS